MIGIQLSVDGAPIVEECFRRRLLINCTHGTVLRLLPALNLTDEQLDEGCAILANALRSVQS
jgi:acetylornithine/succinyldiaminopimelate/putrescine aminotransferase